MSFFVFEQDLERLDARSVFANRICKLLYEKHDGDLDKAIEEAEPFFDELELFVRNIYELVDSEIPLYAYYQLLEYKADNWHFDENEYQEKIENTRLACKLYYE